MSTAARVPFLFLVALASPAAIAAVATEGDVQFGNGQPVVVGAEDDGALTVTAPTVVQSESFTIGSETAKGTVVIDGAEWTNAGVAEIGRQGGGSLTVQNGGTFTSPTGDLGGGDYSASLTVTGSGSVARFEGDFEATGRFDETYSPLSDISIRVLDGGVLTTGGNSGSAGGRVELSGVGSEWRYDQYLSFRNVEMTASSGARLVGSDNSTLTFGGTDSLPRYELHDAGTLLESTGGVLITSNNSGVTTVRLGGGAGAVVGPTSIWDSYVAPVSNARSVLKLSDPGTTWSTSDLNTSGNTEIRITNGAVLQVRPGTNQSIAIGEYSGTSVIRVDGPDTRFTMPQQKPLNLGVYGRGELHLTGGATQSVGSATLGNASTDGGYGLVRVDGDNSSLNVAGRLDVDRGRVELLNGATAYLSRSTYVGYNGELLLDGAEIFTDNGSIGNSGLLSGSGRIEGTLGNTGRLRVGRGQKLDTWAITNGSYGNIEVDGGELEFGYLNQDKNGRVLLNDAVLRFERRYDNASFRNREGGVVLAIGGTSDLHTPVTNHGKFIISGDSDVRFLQPVDNFGVISVSEGSTAFFYNTYRGVGVLGDGRVVFEGVFRDQQTAHFETDVELSSAAEWELSIDGEGSDALVSDRSVELGGELSLLVDAPLGGPGLHELTIVEAEAVLGGFDFTPDVGDHLGGRAVFRGLDYGAESVTLVVEQFAPGDLNADGAVDAADHGAWAAAYGTDDWRADANGDGLVDAADYTLWRDAVSGAVLPVPEPAAALLALFGTLPIRRRAY